MADYLDPRKGRPKAPAPSKGAGMVQKPSKGSGQVARPAPAPAPVRAMGQVNRATIPGPSQRQPTLPSPPQRNPGFNMPGAPAITYPNTPIPMQQSGGGWGVPQGGAGPMGGGGFAGDGGAGFAPMAAPAPPPRQLNEGEWLAGDADFKDQNNEYDRAMNEFRRRIGDRKKNFEDDAKLSNVATQRNQTNTLNGLGEDFAARGLSFSGLFDDRKNKTADSFRNQLANIETVKNRNNAAAEEELADYSSENQLSRGNAKRQALARMAAQQALINAGGAI